MHMGHHIKHVAIRHRRHAPRHRTEKRIQDYRLLLTAHSVQDEGATGFSTAWRFEEFSPSNNILHSPTTASIANPAEPLKGVDADQRIGNEVYVLKEFALLRFKPTLMYQTAWDPSVSRVPVSWARVRIIVLWVYGTNSVKTLPNDVPYHTIFEASGMDQDNKSGGKVDDRYITTKDQNAANLPQIKFKKLHDHVHLVAPYGGSSDGMHQNPAIRINLPARTLKWNADTTLLAHCPTMRGRLVWMAIQHGGGDHNGQSPDMVEDIPSNKYFGTFRWSVDARVRRVWCDPA